MIACYFLFVGGHLVGAPTLPVVFTDNTLSTGVSTEITEMEAALLARINSASLSIDLAIYGFNRDSIRDALIAAHNRGVVVRVVTDDEARENVASYIPYYAALESAGIAIADDNRPSSIQHNKYFVFDGSFVWTGSTNMSDNGFTKNHNNSIVISDTQVAALYTDEFNQMFEQGLFSIHKDPLLTTTVEYNGIPIEFHFSPKGNALNEIIQEVDSATTEIYFSIFFLTSDPLRDALIEAKNRGVKIKGVWDTLGASNAFSDDEALCTAGIPIKRENYIGKMHNKYMVIDPATSKAVVVTGSMNWSVSGSEGNDENTVIIHDPTVAQMFKENFDALYDTLPAELACVEEESDLPTATATPILTQTPTPTTEDPKTAIYLPLIVNPADPNAPALTPTTTPIQTALPTTTPIQTALPTTTPIQTALPTATPIQTQTPTPAPTESVQIVRIVRIVYNPDGDDVMGELVELTNAGTAPADMTGWVIKDVANNQFVFPSFTLSPSASVNLWVKTGTNDAGNLYWNRGSSVWNNTGDSAFLLNGVTIVDSCDYAGGGIEASC
jgi:phosphatidylserine/phosphatidylglycerophosphate/cardiolipin synthase-like enzyme